MCYCVIVLCDFALEVLTWYQSEIWHKIISTWSFCPAAPTVSFCLVVVVLPDRIFFVVTATSTAGFCDVRCCHPSSSPCIVVGTCHQHRWVLRRRSPPSHTIVLLHRRQLAAPLPPPCGGPVFFSHCAASCYVIILFCCSSILLCRAAFGHLLHPATGHVFPPQSLSLRSPCIWLQHKILLGRPVRCPLRSVLHYSLAAWGVPMFICDNLCYYYSLLSLWRRNLLVVLPLCFSSLGFISLLVYYGREQTGVVFV